MTPQVFSTLAFWNLVKCTVSTILIRLHLGSIQTSVNFTTQCKLIFMCVEATEMSVFVC